MNYCIKGCLYALALFNLSGCASIVSGTSQSLFVDTPTVNGAKCQLTDSKSGTWFLESSPGSVTVAKGNGPMNIVCKKEEYKTGTVVLEEGIAGAVLGNIILGGGIGIFVDAATGAAQKYPDKATVWMEPLNWKNEAAKQEWVDKKAAFDLAEEKARKEKEEAERSPPPARH